jgi:hypothetical protein
MASLFYLVRRPAGAETRLPTPPNPQKKITSENDPNPTTALAAETTIMSKRAGPTLMTLPPELHLLIAQYLIYPDALSLKHTNRHFYQLVDTGVRLKVEWLMERRLLHLECPSDSRCDLGSDLRFCRGSVKYVSF